MFYRKIEEAELKFQMEMANETNRRMLEFKLMRSKVNGVYNSAFIRDNTAEVEIPLVTRSVEHGDPVQRFLLKVGYKEKGSEANTSKKSKVILSFYLTLEYQLNVLSQMDIHMQNYDVMEVSNARFVKTGANENAKGAGGGSVEGLKSDLSRFISLWHCGTVVGCMPECTIV